MEELSAPGNPARRLPGTRSVSRATPGRRARNGGREEEAGALVSEKMEVDGVTGKETVRQRLRARLRKQSLIVAPGIYDAYGARFVERAGFEAAYMTGNGVSASVLGQPDVGLVDLTLLSRHAHYAAACIDIPLICDADTGYGNAVNVRHTVREFEAAGVAAIHIEDQMTPKRCGHLPGARPVIELSEAVGKIEAAVAARRDPDFIIIGRTDAATGQGVDAAIARVKAFRQAGADVLFVEIK